MGSSFDTATLITGISDSVTVRNDDYFKFNLQNQGNIALSLTGSANLELFNAFQKKIYESNNPDSTAELINTALDAGIYYVRVSGNSTYSLSLQNQQGQQQNTLFWRNTSTGENAVWTMSGVTIGSNTSYVNTPISWTLEGAIDPSGTKYQSLLWRQSSGASYQSNLACIIHEKCRKVRGKLLTT
jgi:hypothetical protein